MFGQIVSTAAGVAIGSTMANAFGGLFGGQSETSAAPTDAQNTALSQPLPTAQSSNVTERCGPLMMEFSKCMTANGQMSSCQWMFDQVKMCQQNAEADF